MNRLQRLRRIEAATPAMAIVLWLISPLVNGFVGILIYSALLQWNHLVVYHVEDYDDSAGLLAMVACLSVYFVAWPIIRFGFPSLYSKLSVWHWLAAVYTLPALAVLIEVAIDGLPWSERIPGP